MRVIAFKNLPFRLPIGGTLVIVMALDYYNFPEIAKGIVYGLLALTWIAAIVGVVTQKQVNILEDK